MIIHENVNTIHEQTTSNNKQSIKLKKQLSTW